MFYNFGKNILPSSIVLFVHLSVCVCVYTHIYGEYYKNLFLIAILKQIDQQWQKAETVKENS